MILASSKRLNNLSYEQFAQKEPEVFKQIEKKPFKLKAVYSLTVE